MIKVRTTLLVLLATGLLCSVLMMVFPKDGVEFLGIKWEFVQLSDFEPKQDTVEVVNVTELLDTYEDIEVIDSTAIKDSIRLVKLLHYKKMLNLQHPDSTPFHLGSFYDQLKNLHADKNQKVRVLHYGDSQIEGDRISSYIRDQLQRMYGGSGPGYQPGAAMVQSLSVKQTQSDNWVRHAVYGKKDSLLTHKEFGMYGVFSRFTPLVADSDTIALDTTKAWILFKPSYLGYKSSRKYNQLILSLSSRRTPVQINYYVNDSVVDVQWLDSHQINQELIFPVNNPKDELKLEFVAQESPDVYSVRLEQPTGIYLDNVAMRGSSGTIFRRIDRAQFKTQMPTDEVTLVILQYGGNSVPYIDSKERAERFARGLGSQIKYLKSVLPQASFVFIGPSDMSTKINGEMTSYPYLVEVRDALKQICFDNEVAYWDVYEVMGGYNSMPQWVEQDPPLAGHDYIHFTPRGAKKVAELFWKAIVTDYTQYTGDSTLYGKYFKVEVTQTPDEVYKSKMDTAKVDSTLTPVSTPALKEKGGRKKKKQSDQPVDTNKKESGIKQWKDALQVQNPKNKNEK